MYRFQLYNSHTRSQHSPTNQQRQQSMEINNDYNNYIMGAKAGKYSFGNFDKSILKPCGQPTTKETFGNFDKSILEDFDSFESKDIRSYSVFEAWEDSRSCGSPTIIWNCRDEDPLNMREEIVGFNACIEEFGREFDVEEHVPMFIELHDAMGGSFFTFVSKKNIHEIAKCTNYNAIMDLVH